MVKGIGNRRRRTGKERESIDNAAINDMIVYTKGLGKMVMKMQKICCLTAVFNM
ncbi:MAG: hypothetical protein HDR22_03685 [Lachnospiraceae bacterium]|nr:hypothetical protein [Lachnospiraceae bacterium]